MEHRNRAKCRLCSEVIESLFDEDYQICKCAEIAITGGKSCYKAMAKNWENFLRIDDNGTEIQVTVLEKDSDPGIQTKQDKNPIQPLSKEDRIAMLDEEIKMYESLPEPALYQSATQYDLYRFLLIMSSVLRS